MDLGFRTAYRVAHRMLRAYWRIRRPHTHGALVAAWYRGEILIVKNSYRRQYTLPGGYVQGDESAEQAAARELLEEVGVPVEQSRLRLVFSDTQTFENRRDHVSIVAVELEEPVTVKADNREVVWAGFRRPAEVLALPIVPHLRDYLLGLSPSTKKHEKA